MRRGQKIRLLRRPLFGVPVIADLKRSSDGDWVDQGKPTRWLQTGLRSGSDGVRARWLRVGEFVLMLGYIRPLPPPPSGQSGGTAE